MNEIIDFAIANWRPLYLAAGLVCLLMLVRAGMRTPESAEILAESLGRMVLLSLIAWPYVLVCWVFSWGVWLKPVRFNMGGQDQ